MKVIGKYKTVYEYDTADKQKDSEGTNYVVVGNAGIRVKILEKNLCTKEKEQFISSVMTGEIEWHGPTILDMVYSHGKFAGYTYEEIMQEITPPVTPDVPDISIENGGKSGKNVKKKEENGSLKVLYAIGISIVFCLLTYFVFFDWYLSMVDATVSSDIADYCYTFNFFGITGMLGGIVLVFFAAKLMFHASDFIYYVGVTVAFFLGMGAMFLLVTLLIVLVNLIFSVLVAIAPVLIIIAAIIFILKSMFSKKGKK